MIPRFTTSASVHTSGSPRRSIESVGDLIEPVGEQVAVQVQRHGRRFVAEHLLDDLEVRTGCDGQPRRRVAQFMRMQSRSADRLGRRVE